MFGFFSRFKFVVWVTLCSLPALVALGGILGGHARLASLGREWRPMSLSSAVMVLVLAAGLVLAQVNPKRPFQRVAAILAAAAVGCVLIYSFLIMQGPRNAVLSGLGFGAMYLSLGILAVVPSRPWRARQIAALMGLIPLGVGALVLFSYFAGIPLLYETGYEPTSIPTALSLFFMGHALLALAGNDTFPMALFRLERTEMRGSHGRWANRLPLLGFIALASIGGTAGALVMRTQTGTALRAAQSQLAGIADVKAGDLDGWLEERYGDAETILRGGVLQEQLASRLRSGAGGTGDAGLRSWMAALRDLYGYESVALCDVSGRPVLAEGVSKGATGPMNGLREALETRTVRMVDLQAGPDGMGWRLGYWIPVMGPGGAPVGAVNLTMGTAHYLEPFLEDWPALGPRGRISLVRWGSREALDFARPVPAGGEAYFPPVSAARGSAYQERIFSADRPVRRAPWMLTVQIPEATIVAALRPRFWVAAGATLGTVLLFALATGFLVRRYGGMRMRELLALERERKSLAERSKALMREANDIILLLDLDGRILEANERAQASYGYSSEELLGKSGRDLRVPEVADDFDLKWSWLKTQGSGMWETSHRRKDGSVFPVEASCKVISQGGETYVLSFLRDITERHAQALEIRHLTQLYAALGQVGQAVVWTRDREDLFERICDVMVEFGQLRTAWIGAVDPLSMNVTLVTWRGAEDHLARFSPMEQSSPLASVIQDRLPCIMDDVQKDAVNPGSAAAFPVTQAGRVTYILGVVASDRRFFGPGEVELLSETALNLSFALDKLDEEARRAKAEEELVTVEGQLQQSQKMESLGSLAGGVAHDLNNVMGAILSLASTHKEDAGLPPALGKALETIVNACLRGRGVIKSLLYFARKGLEEEHPLDLNGLVRDLAQLLAHTTLKRVTLVQDLEEGLPLVLGDGGALSHAVMNLCVNAVDAMPGGGTLTLGTRWEKDGTLCLWVEDTGEGMKEEVIQKAVEPFFTTKPLGKGTGLGLSMVFGTMKAHGGTLELNSAPGTGTKALLRFPASRVQSAAAAVTRVLPASGPGGTSLSILLVDDDELIRESVGPMLEILGHRVRLASGGQEALDLFHQGLEADLVILDMNMPGMTGAEALPRILDLRPSQHVLMASGYSEQDVAQLLVGRATVQSLRKPFSLSEIQAAIVRLFRG